MKIDCPQPTFVSGTTTPGTDAIALYAELRFVLSRRHGVFARGLSRTNQRVRGTRADAADLLELGLQPQVDRQVLVSLNGVAARASLRETAFLESDRVRIGRERREGEAPCAISRRRRRLGGAERLDPRARDRLSGRRIGDDARNRPRRAGQCPCCLGQHRKENDKGSDPTPESLWH
jgi:hypothetical protein